MNEKDELQREMITEKLVSRHGFEREEITSIIDECIKEKGADACETAYKVFICYRSHRIIKERFTAERAASNSTWKVHNIPVTTTTPSTITPSNVNVINKTIPSDAKASSNNRTC